MEDVDEDGGEAQLGEDDSHVHPEDAPAVPPRALYRYVDVVEESHDQRHKLDAEIGDSNRDEFLRSLHELKERPRKWEEEKEDCQSEHGAQGRHRGHPASDESVVPGPVGLAHLYARAHRKPASQRGKHYLNLADVGDRGDGHRAYVGSHHRVEHIEDLRKALVESERSAYIEDDLHHVSVQCEFPEFLVLL